MALLCLHKEVAHAAATKDVRLLHVLQKANSLHGNENPYHESVHCHTVRNLRLERVILMMNKQQNQPNRNGGNTKPPKSGAKQPNMDLMLAMVGKKLGVPPEKLKQAVSSGDMGKVLASLPKNEAAKMQSFMKDKGSMEKVMKSAEATDLLKKMKK